MAEKIKAGHIVGGLAVLGGTIALIYAFTRKVKAVPPEEPAGTIEIEVIGAQHSSPATVVEGETYTVRLTVTNLSTTAGQPCEATLRISIGATVFWDTFASEVLIPAQERTENFAAGQTRTFNYTMHVSPGLGGYSGSIGASVMDPTGLIVLDQATEPLVVEAEVVEIIYGATVTIGV